MSKKKNGYVRVPVADPDEEPSPDTGAGKRGNLQPLNLKPGLFAQFGKDRRHKTEKDAHSESEDIEMVLIKPRRVKHKKLKSPKTKKPQMEIIEEPILTGDTIQRISLRYGCSVAELRRINKLYSDLDFHALKTIKVPIKENSVLTEAKERETRRKLISEDVTNKSTTQSSSEDVHLGGPDTYYNSDISQDADDEEANDSDAPEYRDISLQSALKWKHSQHALLQKLDIDLQRVKETNEAWPTTNAHEVRLTVEAPTIHPISLQHPKQFMELPDWRVVLCGGISVIVGLSLCMIVLCISSHCPV